MYCILLIPAARATNVRPKARSRVTAAWARAVRRGRLADGRSGRNRIFFRTVWRSKCPRVQTSSCNIIFIPRANRRRRNRSSEIYFAKKAPDRRLTRIQMPPDYSLFSDLNIPAGQKDFVIRDSYTLPVAVDAVGVSAHAHYLRDAVENDRDAARRPGERPVDHRGLRFCLAGPIFFKDFVPLPEGRQNWTRRSTGTIRQRIRTTRAARRSTSSGAKVQKDEMGSISLLAVTQIKTQTMLLNGELRARSNRNWPDEKMTADPVLRKKVMEMLAE